MRRSQRRRTAATRICCSRPVAGLLDDHAARGGLRDPRGGGRRVPGRGRHRRGRGSTQTSRSPPSARRGVAGTVIKGIVADPGSRPDADDVRRHRAAAPDGVLNTPDDVYKLPIADAKVTILGYEDRPSSPTRRASFEIDDVPAGDVKLAIDGRTATNAPAGYLLPRDGHGPDASRPGVVNTPMGSMGTPDEQAGQRRHLRRRLPAARADRSSLRRQRHRADDGHDHARSPRQPDAGTGRAADADDPAGQRARPERQPVSATCRSASPRCRRSWCRTCCRRA